MKKPRKPLSSKKPPVPSEDYQVIKDWMQNRIMPSILPLVEALDAMIKQKIQKPRYAVKWGNAFYGSEEKGWQIEVAAYDVSVNIVFLNGALLDPQPPLGDLESRYVKVRSTDDLKDLNLVAWLDQAVMHNGWK